VTAGDPRLPASSRAAGFASGRALLLLGAVVVLGAVILHSLDRGAAPYANVRSGSATETTQKKSTTRTTRVANTTTTTATTTIPPRPPSEVKVLPVNGTNTAGVGGRTGDLLRRAGYNVLSPINTPKPVDASTVQFSDGHQSDALAVAAELALPSSAVIPLQNPPPVADTRGADVVVIVGPDLAARMGATSGSPASSSSSSGGSTATTLRRTTTTTSARPIPTVPQSSLTTTTTVH
jgi:hypothetical protein